MKKRRRNKQRKERSETKRCRLLLSTQHNRCGPSGYSPLQLVLHVVLGTWEHGLGQNSSIKLCRMRCDRLGLPASSAPACFIASLPSSLSKCPERYKAAGHQMWIRSFSARYSRSPGRTPHASWNSGRCASGTLMRAAGGLCGSVSINSNSASGR